MNEENTHGWAALDIEIVDEGGQLGRDLEAKKISLGMPEGTELARVRRLYGGVVETVAATVTIVRFTLWVTGLDKPLKVYAKALWDKFKDYNTTITIGGQETDMDPDSIEATLGQLVQM